MPGKPMQVHAGTRQAFTLIELVIVMTVIAAMATMTYGYLDYSRHRSTGRHRRARPKRRYGHCESSRSLLAVYG